MADVVGDGVLDVRAELNPRSLDQMESTVERRGRGFSAVLAGAVGGAVASVVSKAIDTVTASIGSAINRVDILNNFPRVMQNLGFSADDAAASIDTIATELQGLPTSLQSLASGVQRISSSFSTLDEATDTALALNNALLAGGAPLANQEAAFEQYAQAIGRGKFEMQEWRSLQTAMPGQLNQVAAALLGAGNQAGDLYAALQEGTVGMDDFNRAIVQLNAEGANGFASFEQQARDATGGIGTQIANLENAITRNLANAIDRLAPLITTVVSGMTAFANEAGNVLLPAIDGLVTALGWMGDNLNIVVPILAGVGAVILGAVIPAFIAWVAATWPLVTAQIALAAAMLANPMTWIIVGIGALIAGLVALAMNWDAVVAWVTDVWGGFISWVTGVIEGFVGWWDGVWGGISSFFESVWQGIVSWARSVIGGFLSWWNGVWSAISGFFIGIWEGIVAFVTPIFEFIGGLIAGYVEVWYNIFLVFAAVLKVIWDGIVAVVTWVWETIVAYVTPIVENFVAFITLAIQGAQIVWETVWGAISSFFITIWEGIVAFFMPIIETISNVITSTITAIQTVWDAVWDAVSSFWQGVWQGIIDFLTPIIETIYNVIVGTIQAVSNWWNDIWNGISSFFTNIWNTMVSEVSGAVNRVFEVVGTIYDKVMGVFAAVGDWLYNTGRDLITGFFKGVESMWNWITEQIGSFFGGIVDWARGVLGMASPSKVFAEIGRDTMRGYIIGMESMAGAVDDAIGGILSPSGRVVGFDGFELGFGAGGRSVAPGGAGMAASGGLTVAPGAIVVQGDGDPEMTSIRVLDRLVEEAVLI